MYTRNEMVTTLKDSYIQKQLNEDYSVFFIIMSVFKLF